MLLSRTKSSFFRQSIASKYEPDSKNIPSLEEFIVNRDYTGAITLLKYKKMIDKDDQDIDFWIGYCHFHLGQYQLCLNFYQSLINEIEGVDKNKIQSKLVKLVTRKNLNSSLFLDKLYLYLGCCYFMLGEYKNCLECIKKNSYEDIIKDKLKFHLSHKNGANKASNNHQEKLKDDLQNQLCLASIHYNRSQFQEAIDIYTKILDQNLDFVALNIYIALCYYKLDYFDKSQELIALYLQQFSDSVTAINLKACNYYRLYNNKAAENELRSFINEASSSFDYAKELIRHNLVVFRNGEGAMQVFPSLIDVIPEARLNQAIYYLKSDNISEAFNLMKNLEPTTPYEYILKALVNVEYGQEKKSKEHLKMAQQYFQLVGGSESKCDTIPGRQCMASCFFLMKKFDDVLLYLSSIKSFFYNDDAFNFNYGQAKAASGQFLDAKKALSLITSKKILSDPVYISWMIRCHILCKKPEKAWELYETWVNTPDAFNYLLLIANDCYKMGQFFYSLKAFDNLEKADSNPEYWEGKRGSAVGLFQAILAGKEPKKSFNLILSSLKNIENRQAKQICDVIKDWKKENKMSLVCE